MTKRTSSMAATTLDPSLSPLQPTNKQTLHRPVVVEEINGLIRVYRDGHVDRAPVVPSVTCSLSPELGVISRDVTIDKYTSIWARFYVPVKLSQEKKLPLMVYFHGGGFCVGSASWSCYHEFLAKLASRTRCIIMSVNYRLAPENPLPAAYDDGVQALVWLGQQNINAGPVNEWWSSKCDFFRVFLAGDSAGANIAYNVTLRVKWSFFIKGLVLVQPFFGGEVRTWSEECMAQPKGSFLTVATADAYWRMSLPVGANRDHPWCNPAAEGAAGMEEMRGLPVMVCVAEMDVLKDRNLEMCARLAGGGARVETVVCGGVGHAFQILDKSALAQTRAHELICHVNNFVNR